jgi:AcrR family transcriptional regulator
VTDNEDLLGRRRAQIAEAAYDQFAESGFQFSSVSEVARRAGMDKRTMYDYVGDKRDVLYLVFLHFLPQQLRMIGGALDDADDPPMQLSRMGHEHLSFLERRPGLALLYYREMRYLSRDQIRDCLWFIGEVVALYEEAIRRGIDRRLMASPEPHVAARMFAAALDMPTLVAWDLGGYDRAAVEQEILRATLDGLRVR